MALQASCWVLSDQKGEQFELPEQSDKSFDWVEMWTGESRLKNETRVNCDELLGTQRLVKKYIYLNENHNIGQSSCFDGDVGMNGLTDVGTNGLTDVIVMINMVMQMSCWEISDQRWKYNVYNVYGYMYIMYMVSGQKDMKEIM